MEYSNLFVCLMGMGTVFFGLIAIIVLVSIMSGIVTKTEKAMSKPEAVKSVPAQAPEALNSGNVTPELIAAVSAAIAEEMGTDVNAIRIVSLKKA